MLVPHDDGLAVFGAVGGVQRREVGERAQHRVGDEVGEAHLARAGARELVVQDLAVDLQQLGGNDAHRRGGGDPQARLHVLHGARRASAERLGFVALEQEGSRARGGRQCRCHQCRCVGERRRGRRGRGGRRGSVAGAVLEVVAPVARRPRPGSGGIAGRAPPPVRNWSRGRRSGSRRHARASGWGVDHPRRSSATWNARSRDWRALRRGSQLVS